MKNNSCADNLESISLCVSQIEFLHKVSVQQGSAHRHIPDMLILDVLQKLKSQLHFYHSATEGSCEFNPVVSSKVEVGGAHTLKETRQIIQDSELDTQSLNHIPNSDRSFHPKIK
ncbi:hypothetical protein M5U04_20760 [Xenorhabdus sp. XENO-1]|uniref:hypothetical protein n=1 Tax=Xenorhabdus bovienii TaxID=40576 RepID=UPI0020CA6F62|nr:hypothetical protein [Xenorhabdus bovienii]MCP9270432.1 hypothetical protein [Xenorhabdus bovienii subsp. africana]